MSKEQIAINRLMCGNTAHSCKADYIQLAIQALEKQIPKEPITTYNDNYVDEIYHCPTCNRLVEYKEHHCRCGQKMKWGDEE